MGATVISVRGLHYTYMQGTPFARHALRGVDLDIQAGEAVGIVGATGSGKSTLLQHLNGLYRPQVGQVIVLGHDLGDPRVDIRRVRQMVGLVFQRPEQQLFAQYVGDDVAYGPRMFGLPEAEVRARVQWAMELVGLDFGLYKDRLTWTLSGGEQRKAALAGVLALRPRVLILDEPTAGLDPQGRSELLRYLQRLREEGIELIVASHNMDDIAILTERVYVLDNGRVALSGSTRDVLTSREELLRLGLDVPPAVDILAKLRERGVDVANGVLTLAEAENAIADWLERRINRWANSTC